jgi:hypothetical protein
MHRWTAVVDIPDAPKRTVINVGIGGDLRLFSLLCQPVTEAVSTRANECYLASTD